MRGLCKTPLYPLITWYQARGMVQDGLNGPIRSIPCVMLVDRLNVAKLAFTDSLLDQTVSLSNIVFEGVRRFVIEHVLAPGDLIPPSLLSEICERHIGVSILRERLVHGFYQKGNATEQELRIEMDVQMIALITQVVMKDRIDLHGKATFEELLPFLTLGKSKLTPTVRKGILSFFE
jgi:hypothetical protein